MDLESREKPCAITITDVASVYIYLLDTKRQLYTTNDYGKSSAKEPGTRRAIN